MPPTQAPKDNFEDLLRWTDERTLRVVPGERQLTLQQATQLVFHVRDQNPATVEIDLDGTQVDQVRALIADAGAWLHVSALHLRGLRRVNGLQADHFKAIDWLCKQGRLVRLDLSGHDLACFAARVPENRREAILGMFDAIACDPLMETLTLRGCSLNPQDMAALAEALFVDSDEASLLVNLSLAGNDFSGADLQLDLVDMFDMIESSLRLEQLDVTGIAWGTDSLAAALACLEKCTTLHALHPVPSPLDFAEPKDHKLAEAIQAQLAQNQARHIQSAMGAACALSSRGLPFDLVDLVGKSILKTQHEPKDRPSDD